MFTPIFAISQQVNFHPLHIVSPKKKLPTKDEIFFHGETSQNVSFQERQEQPIQGGLAAPNLPLLVGGMPPKEPALGHACLGCGAAFVTSDNLQAHLSGSCSGSEGGPASKRSKSLGGQKVPSQQHASLGFTCLGCGEHLPDAEALKRHQHKGQCKGQGGSAAGDYCDFSGLPAWTPPESEPTLDVLHAVPLGCLEFSCAEAELIAKRCLSHSISKTTRDWEDDDPRWLTLPPFFKQHLRPPHAHT